MSDFGASVLINVPAEQVFEFASEPENMPQYLPSVTFAQRLGDGRVRIGGKRFEADAWFDIDEHHLMMRWGAEGDACYVGHLTVTPMDAFSSKAEVHLICNGGDRCAEIQRTMDVAVAKIRQICEGISTKIPDELQLGKRYMS